LLIWPALTSSTHGKQSFPKGQRSVRAGTVQRSLLRPRGRGPLVRSQSSLTLVSWGHRLLLFSVDAASSTAELSPQLVEEVQIRRDLEMETSKSSGVFSDARAVNARCNGDYSSVARGGGPCSSSGRLWSPASLVQGLRDRWKVLRRSDSRLRRVER
jgi:hypothetical protein